jgi:hypothetical protein
MGAVRPLVIVVVGIVPQHSTQVLLVENNHVVQAFPSDGTDQALDIGVPPRGTRRRRAAPIPIQRSRLLNTSP